MRGGRATAARCARPRRRAPARPTPWRSRRARSGSKPDCARRNRHRHDVARPARRRAEEAGRILGGEHAADQHERSRIAILDLGEGLRDRRSRRRDCGRRRARCRRRPAPARPAAPDLSRCMRAGQSALTKPRLECAWRRARTPARRSVADGEPGIVDLVARREASAAAGRAGRPRPGRRAARARRRPCSRCRGGRAARPPPSPRARSSPARACPAGATMPGTPRFRMPAFSAAIAGEVGRRGTPRGRG